MTRFVVLAMLITIAACNSEQNIDLVIYNVKGYTVDEENEWVEAIAVSEGAIVALGTDTDILNLKSEGTKLVNGEGAFLMPGFIEGHGHFNMIGQSLINVNLLTARSWEEVIARVEARVKDAAEGEWIVGRGWHQEKWNSIPSPNIHNYPYHDKLSAISPNNPVVLIHASGHSLFANRQAMAATGISKETPNPSGGEIVRDFDGSAIGVFEERAMTSIKASLNEYISSLDQEEVDAQWYKATELATEECLKKGITSFQDAGSKFYEIERYTQLAKEGKLDLRLWAMARDTFGMLKDNLATHKTVDAGNRFFTCNAVKSEVDGALGAFGAWLLKPYNDKPEFIGQNTTDIYDVKRIADLALKHDMQFCVHAIGDRANRVVLDIFEGVLGDSAKVKRWRIEHAQHLDPDDIPRFAKYGIIASMQGVHCTSDAPFVEKRLGKERSRLGAYAWRSLLDAGVVIANGTDAPVEDVDPIKSFYASVTRKRVDNEFEFFAEQSMTRAEAIKSYTLGNAFAAFQDSYKGSLTIGKVADFTMLSNDLIHCTEQEILSTEVLMTVVDGMVKYQKGR